MLDVLSLIYLVVSCGLGVAYANGCDHLKGKHS